MSLAIRYRLIDIARGTDSVGLLKSLRAWQFESPEQLNARTQKQLEQYFNELREAVPMFRQVTRFEDLPIIDKPFVNQHLNELMNPNFKGAVIRKKTGGSTGVPLIYYTGVQSQSYLWAGIYLSWEVAGFKFGDKVAFLAGPSLFATGYKQSIYFRLLNVTLLSAFNMTAETMSEYGRQLQNSAIRLLYGYPSAVHLLARHFLDAGKTLSTNLRGIVCTAETMTPVMRKDIEAAFGVPCYSQYGCHDAGVSAFECEHRNGFHLISTRSYTEVLPDGQFISTDLSNRTMFMPRYNTGDIVRQSGRQCPCGRGFPLLDEVLGRQNDMVVDTRGTTVHSLFFIYLFREDVRILSFQVIFDETQLDVNLHVKQLDDQELALLEHNVREIISKTLVFKHLNIIYNLPFTSLPNGKHSFVIRKSTLTNATQSSHVLS
ncbi:phenylacetate-CoA ligase [Oxalobacteraceae bacterium GrIS 2.11]